MRGRYAGHASAFLRHAVVVVVDLAGWQVFIESHIEVALILYPSRIMMVPSRWPEPSEGSAVLTGLSVWAASCATLAFPNHGTAPFLT